MKPRSTTQDLGVNVVSARRIQGLRLDWPDHEALSILCSAGCSVPDARCSVPVHSDSCYPPRFHHVIRHSILPSRSGRLSKPLPSLCGSIPYLASPLTLPILGVYGSRIHSHPHGAPHHMISTFGDRPSSTFTTDLPLELPRLQDVRDFRVN